MFILVSILKVLEISFKEISKYLSFANYPCIWSELGVVMLRHLVQRFCINCVNHEWRCNKASPSLWVGATSSLQYCSLQYWKRQGTIFGNNRLRVLLTTNHLHTTNTTLLTLHIQLTMKRKCVYTLGLIFLNTFYFISNANPAYPSLWT